MVLGLHSGSVGLLLNNTGHSLDAWMGSALGSASCWFLESAGLLSVLEDCMLILHNTGLSSFDKDLTLKVRCTGG